MDMRKLYWLTGRILETFHPSWYEAKEERTQEGKTVWFHGFEDGIAVHQAALLKKSHKNIDNYCGQ